MLLGERELRSMGIPQARPVQAEPLNPYGRGLQPGEFGSGTTPGCETTRVSFAGGALNQLIMHPSVVPFEQLYRKLPEEGMFSLSVSPNRPFVFELGAFRVPDTMAIMLFDLRPDIYRFSGIDAGDFVPVEARRFSSIMGFDVQVDQRPQGNIQFQLDPAPIQFTGQQAFAPNPGVSDFSSVLNISSASSFANVAGTGNSLNPQRPEHYGAQSLPFTMFARSKQTVQIRCVIFRPIPSPIAFIEYDIAGILLPEKYMDQLLKQVSPCVGGV
jgi:hypothetical protein